MDLKFSNAVASEEEAAALDAAGLTVRADDEDARPRRHRLLPALHAVNDVRPVGLAAAIYYCVTSECGTAI